MFRYFGVSIFRCYDVSRLRYFEAFVLFGYLNGDGFAEVHLVSIVHIIGVEPDKGSRTNEYQHLVEWNFYVVVPLSTVQPLTGEKVYP